MTAPAEQLQFVWQAARYIYKASNQAAPPDPAELQADLSSLLELRDSIVQQLPDDQKGHFSISQADVERLAEEAKAAVVAAGEGGLAGATSAISLETVGDALAVGQLLNSAAAVCILYCNVCQDGDAWQRHSD